MRFFTSTRQAGVVTALGACCAGLFSPVACAVAGINLPAKLTLVLSTTQAGEALGADGLRRGLNTALMADAPSGTSALQSLHPLGGGHYALTLACANEAACRAALARLAGLGEWIAGIEPDRTVRHPRPPSPRDPSAR